MRFKLNHGVYKKTQEREYSLWVGDIDKEVGEDELYRAFSGRYNSIRTARSKFFKAIKYRTQHFPRIDHGYLRTSLSPNLDIISIF